MISIDDHPPPDPSSSHSQTDHHHLHQHQISRDLKIPDIDLKSPDADLDDTNQLSLPSFSIRDYVFGLRSKDVGCNWPFSPTSLQLCLKHGVKNLLPPFQSLDLLRDNSSFSKCILENRLPNEEIVSSIDGKPTDDQNQLKSSRSKGEKVSQFHLEEHLAHTRSKEKPPASQKTENVKKIKSVMKLNSGVEPVEEVAPNSFIVSEIMTSKVCPVCKIFSSSSNTTLNAHIDQCLTGEASLKWTDHNRKVIVKHRIKPRKTRLMVDIYKTAPHCTVEELDRRNGTSWANNSSFPAQEFQFQVEEDKEEPRMTTINPEVADNEGDVYIDTDGTKVRILSVPKAGSSDNHGAWKLLNAVKGSKIVTGKKKSNLYKQKHHQKYLKLSPNAKKLCSPKPQIVDEQARSDQGEGVVIAENCRKVDQGREIMKAHVHMKMADLAIVRPPWACSKRTGLAKKFNGKHRKVELQCHATKDLVVQSDKSSSGCDLETPPSSSNNMASSQVRKKMRTSSPLIGQQPLTRMHDDSDDADTRSKGSKFSSLKKNLSFPEAKFDLKRKFSKSRVHCLLNEKSVDEPSEDSSRKQSRMEEHIAARKKEETRSIASKSSNGESSVGVETALRDVESVRNETLIFNVDQADGSFMGLRNSFDPEFSKKEQIHQLHQEQLCSTNFDGKNIFGNDIKDGTDDVEKHENYFQEVDLIPIPGPPGSFLPSPGGDMVSEEQLEANSSLTTATRVLSTETQHHHDTIMDRDSMSNSPVSTVSNPSLARSDSRSSDKLSYRSTLVDATYKKLLPNGEMSFPEKGPSSTIFKNDQPCCCSRKEGDLNYHESLNSRKQPVELNFGSEMFSLSYYPTSPSPETVIFPTIKLPVYSDCDSAASPSKPVLRLMGKNLTVVKSDESVPSSLQQFRPPQQPVSFNQYQNGSGSQQFNVHPPVIMKSHVDSRPIHGGFMASVDCYGHGGLHLGSHHGYNGFNSQVARGRNVYNAASGSNAAKEIIIIDDSSPENEADDSLPNEFLRRNGGQMNPLYTMYQSRSSAHPYGGGGGGSSVFRGGSFRTSLVNGDLGKWNCGPTSGSSSPSRSTSHVRSSTAYYPPSYP